MSSRLGAAVAVLSHTATGSWHTASSGTYAYDLLIAGGRVIDPARKLSADRDVAIAGGRIAQVAAGISRNRAREVLDARGKIVAPGLIDMHVHVFDGVALASIEPDAVAVLELSNREIELRDSTRDVRTGRQTVTRVATIKSGRLLKS